MCSKCRELPIENLLATGTTRAVFAHGDRHVLKSGCHTKWGHMVNESEYHFWQKIKDTEDAKFFAEIVDFASFPDDDGNFLTYGWLIMERVVHTLIDEYSKQGMSYAKMCEQPEMREVRKIERRLNMSDLHPGNVGRRDDGSWVIIDYGE